MPKMICVPLPCKFPLASFILVKPSPFPENTKCLVVSRPEGDGVGKQGRLNHSFQILSIQGTREKS